MILQILIFLFTVLLHHFINDIGVYKHDVIDCSDTFPTIYSDLIFYLQIMRIVISYLIPIQKIYLAYFGIWGLNWIQNQHLDPNIKSCSNTSRLQFKGGVFYLIIINIQAIIFLPLKNLPVSCNHTFSAKLKCLLLERQWFHRSS